MEVFLTSKYSCKEIVESDKDLYKFRIGKKLDKPPLNYFKFMINFSKGLPNKVGMKWKNRNSPVYFSNQF